MVSRCFLGLGVLAVILGLAPEGRAAVFSLTLTESTSSTEPDREWSGTFQIDDALLLPNTLIPLDDFGSLGLRVGAETYTLADADNPLTEGVQTDAAGTPTAFEDPSGDNLIRLSGSVFQVEFGEAATSSWTESQTGVGLTGRMGTYGFTPRNRLPNPFFHTDTTGWSAENGGVLAHDPLDQGGSATSGSLLVTVGSPTAGATSPCVAVDPNTDYRLGAWHAVAPSEIRFESILIETLWFDAEDCAASSTGSGSLPLSGDNTGVFVLSEGTITSPADAMGARVTLLVASGAGLGNTEARFDSVFLPEPTAAWGGLALLLSMGALRHRR